MTDMDTVAGLELERCSGDFSHPLAPFLQEKEPHSLHAVRPQVIPEAYCTEIPGRLSSIGGAAEQPLDCNLRPPAATTDTAERRRRNAAASIRTFSTPAAIPDALLDSTMKHSAASTSRARPLRAGRGSPCLGSKLARDLSKRCTRSAKTVGQAGAPHVDSAVVRETGRHVTGLETMRQG